MYRLMLIALLWLGQGCYGECEGRSGVVLTLDTKPGLLVPGVHLQTCHEPANGMLPTCGYTSYINTYVVPTVGGGTLSAPNVKTFMTEPDRLSVEWSWESEGSRPMQGDRFVLRVLDASSNVLYYGSVEPTYERDETECGEDFTAKAKLPSP